MYRPCGDLELLHVLPPTMVPYQAYELTTPSLVVTVLVGGALPDASAALMPPRLRRL